MTPCGAARIGPLRVDERAMRRDRSRCSLCEVVQTMTDFEGFGQTWFRFAMNVMLEV